MTVFLSGGAKCGKSSLAQELALRLSEGGRLCYVATLIPTGEEDYDRITRHLEDRAGMGFETVECEKNVLAVADPEGTFLVDSVTSLVQNALFPVEKGYEMDLEGARRCGEALVRFASEVKHAVYVSDYIYSDAERYSESTEAYRNALADIDRKLAKVCDVVIEVAAGQRIFYKGEGLL